MKCPIGSCQTNLERYSRLKEHIMIEHAFSEQQAQTICDLVKSESIRMTQKTREQMAKYKACIRQERDLNLVEDQQNERSPKNGNTL